MAEGIMGVIKKGRGKGRKIPGGQRTIGFIGTTRGVGTTHYTIMTAGYLSGVLRESCAVLEWNSHGDVGRLGKACLGMTGIAAGDLPQPFTVLETDYYQEAGTKELLQCKTSGYQDILVDYGAVEEGNLEEFLRCDRQFLIGSLSEWQVDGFLKNARDLAGQKRYGQNPEICAAFGSEEIRENAEKLLHCMIRRIPYSADAFEITPECLTYYQLLF